MIMLFSHLHGVTYSFTVSQDLAQVLGSQHITQGGLRQQTRGTICILHIGDGCRGIMDSEINHCIHSYSYTVLGQNLHKQNE